MQVKSNYLKVEQSNRQLMQVGPAIPLRPWDGSSEMIQIRHDRTCLKFLQIGVTGLFGRANSI
jgi:hypothetical protein